MKSKSEGRRPRREPSSKSETRTESILSRDGQSFSEDTRTFRAWVVAKRMECVELAPAFDDPRPSTEGASSTHSIRFARSGCGSAAPRYPAAWWARFISEFGF